MTKFLTLQLDNGAQVRVNRDNINLYFLPKEESKYIYITMLGSSQDLLLTNSPQNRHILDTFL